MSGVAVLIPTRDRKPQFLTAVESIRKTSSAQVFAYCDADASPYGDVPGVTFVTGPRIGCAKSLNALAEWITGNLPEVRTFAMMTDDSTMMSKDWDVALEAALVLFPARIGVVSPRCSIGGAHRVDMPAMSREFFEAVGFYSHPEMCHYGWPSVIDALADGICLRKMDDGSFDIEHKNIGSRISSFEHDAAEFYQWYAWHKDHGREALMNKIAESIR